MTSTKSSGKRMQWTAAQDKFLVSLVDSSDVNWTEISSQINEKFPKVGRTGKM